ncbi:MAG: aminopeptidase P family protein [Acidobacteria bacterium]|nr:aminopeptidase P family protein [Acidobacteriota bacterium]
MSDISRIQAEIDAAGLDGWLFYGFHDVDPIAIDILGLPRDRLYSRRWFYLVPARGAPGKLVNRIERDALDGLPGERLEYTRWEELSQRLRGLLHSTKVVAMQYSPDSAIPYVSRVDGGILDLVRKCGVQVVTSADLVQRFQAVWSEAQLRSHQVAAIKLHRIVLETFGWIQNRFQDETVDEYQIQQQMLRLFQQERLVADHSPIVALNDHASNPHFAPSRETARQARRGDILLIDLWGKEASAGAVYADITWMGVVDEQVNGRYGEIFNLAARARDAGVALLRERWEEGKKVRGWEVDSAVRQVIEEAGLAEYFVHRTGHSIGEDLHSSGVNLDNLETRDEREVIAGVGFSVEPGIYLPEFGVRTEINVYVDPQKGPQVTTQPIQRELVKILA